jgi:murein L,D-transpeptidase YafK
MAHANEKLYPAALLEMDNYFSHHIIVAEKSTHRLYLFTQEDGLPKLLKVYQMATGKKSGDKLFQGDHRTPEGIYYLTDFLTHQDLINRHGKQGEIYGVGAFVLNYPNPIDSTKGKTGSGIWLHSTNDETRIDKGLDSRGCIVTANAHLIDIAKYIELNKTQMIVVHELNFLNEKTWRMKRASLKETIQTWATSWREENFTDYITQYHKEFVDPLKGKLPRFRSYKKAVFAAPGKPEITMENLTILQTGEYAVATFIQDYQSATIQDTGRKTLYLKRDEYYKWKIVSEKWSKSGMDEKKEKLAFRPSMRFFKTTNPGQILGETWLDARNLEKGQSNN